MIKYLFVSMAIAMMFVACESPSHAERPTNEIGTLQLNIGWDIRIARDEPRHVTCYVLPNESISCVRDEPTK